MTARRFANPVPGVALGDPFVLRHRGRFYLYGTNDGPMLPDGRAIPVFRSDDLLTWEPLGGALVPEEPGADHWAPEVLAWNGKFFMVVSFGDVDRRGHALWVAVADRPEGPFRLRKRISDESEKFSIDGSWLLDDDGRLYLFRCLDFTDEADPPHGTGIVVQPMRDPLTPSGPPATVLRAHSPWHLFEADRPMPLYEGRRFAEWTTIEGPAPVKRGGRYYCGYSGGNYARAYGTGEAVADAPLGPYRDLRGREGPIFATTPGLVEGPGHFSVIRPDLVHDWIVLHGRTPGEPIRRVWLCPATWGDDGVTIGPLTDHPQPAPPLPADLSRFDGPAGSSPVGWRAESGLWTLDGEGLRQVQDGEGASLFREGIELAGAWAVEAYLRFPEVDRAAGAGLLVRSGEVDLEIFLDASPGGGLIVTGTDRRARHAAFPTLGVEPFDLAAFHAIEVRAASGRAEVRVDGVVVARGVSVPIGPSRLGLYAHGIAAFDAVSIAFIEG
jgi:arabinan endo-1,5-alpha-L-arabinosidase